jgi:hypothetical protein
MDSTNPPGTATKTSNEGRTGSRSGLSALPIHLVDLGKAKPKAIKALKKGGGKLHQAVLEALGEIEFNLGAEVAGKTILPVVVVVEKKKKQSGFPLLDRLG